MKRQKLDTNANSFPGCPDEFYCEYYSNGYEWFLVNANTQSGYFCPPVTEPGDPGDLACTDPEPDPETQVASFSEGEHYVEYEYKDGKFTLKQANCPVGYHAPADPLEFAKQHGTLRIYPARIDKPDGSKKV